MKINTYWRVKREKSVISENTSQYNWLMTKWPDAILIHDLDGNIIDANKKAAALLGYSIRKIRSLKIGDIDASGMGQEWYQKYWQGLKRKNFVTLNSVYKKRNGDNIPVELHLLSPNTKNHNLIFSFVRDITDQKITHAELQQSKRLLESSESIANMGSWEWFPRSNQIHLSVNALKLYGISPGTINGNPESILRVIHPDDISKVKQRINRILQNEEVESLIYRIIKPNGEITIIESTIKLNLNKKGDIISLLGHIQDITERKKQHEIIEVRNRLVEFASDHSVKNILQKFLDEAELLTGSEVGFYHFLEDDQETLSLQAWSTNTLKHMCQAEGEGLHYPVSQAGVWVDCILARKPLIHNDYESLPHKKGLPKGHAPVIRQMVVPVFRGEKIVAILGVGNKPTDYTRHDIKLIKDLAELAWDIIERNKAEEKALKLSKAVEQSPESIVITDHNGRIEYVNPKFVELTGYSMKEALGNVPTILNHECNSNNTISNDIWNTIQKGTIWQGEFHNSRKNNKVYWENVRIAPIKNINNTITNYVILKEDITAKKKMLAELKDEKMKAQESDRLKTAFLNNMSHEIRTPMSGIIGFSELLTKPGLTAEQQLQYVEVINQSSSQLLSVVNDILDIAKIESGQLTIKEEEVNLKEICTEVLGIHQLAADEKNIVLKKCDYTSCCLENAFVDKPKVIQVLNNLVNNAIKFTQEGWIQLKCKVINNQIEFSVTDTGIGIDKELHSKIFDRFRQAELSATRSFGGTGLGLSICKGLATLLKGKIWLKSSAGKGSTFYFTIPYKPSRAILQNPTNETKKLVDYSKYTILVVEDEEINYRYINELLRNINIKHVHAKNGKEAIEQFKNHNEINMILMDIKMPVMNGYDATREIRKMNDKIPIIAFTAHAFAEDREKALLAGCSDHLAKPVREKTLQQTITKHLVTSNTLRVV